MNRFFLRWPAQPGQTVHWLELGQQTASANEQAVKTLATTSVLASGSVTIAELNTLSSMAAKREVIVLLPAAMGVITPVLVPAKQQKHLTKVLPFLIEDIITGSVDELHVVAGPKLDDERLLALAIARSTLREILLVLAAAGIQPAKITFDGLCLPRHDASANAGAHLLLEQNESLLRLQDGQVQLIHNADLVALLPYLLADQALTVLRADADLPTPDAAEVHDISASLPFLAEHFGAHAVDLLQGEFVVKRDQNALMQQWRWPLALAASVLILLYISLLTDWWLLNRQQQIIRTAMVETYRSAFPNAGEIKNPYAAMKGQMKSVENSGGAGLLNKLDKITPLLQQTGVTVRVIGYDAEGDMRIDVVAKELNALNELQSLLSNNGFPAEMGQAAAGEGGFSGRVQIKGAEKKKKSASADSDAGAQP